MSKTYSVKEIFYSPQGEGLRVGTMNVFLRFAGCNLQCSVDREGFNCDTDFAKGSRVGLKQLVESVEQVGGPLCKNVIFTGGEPSLQLDDDLLIALKRRGFYCAIETNGTRPLPHGLDWISCSPKPGSPPVIKWADEVRCVIKAGQVPDTQGIKTFNRVVSPACDAPPVEQIPGWHSSAADLNRSAIEWAVKWCEQNPSWRISIQTHKILGVR